MNATAVSSLGKGWYAGVGMGNKRMFTLNENPQLPMVPAQARCYN